MKIKILDIDHLSTEIKERIFDFMGKINIEFGYRNGSIFVEEDKADTARNIAENIISNRS